MVAVLLGFGAQHDPPLLVISSGIGGQVRFVLEMPPFPALDGAQRRTRWSESYAGRLVLSHHVAMVSFME